MQDEEIEQSKLILAATKKLPERIRLLTRSRTEENKEEMPRKEFHTYEEFMRDKLQEYKKALGDYYKGLKRVKYEICYNYKCPIVRCGSKKLLESPYKSSSRRSSLVIKNSKSENKTLISFFKINNKEPIKNKLSQQRASVGSARMNSIKVTPRKSTNAFLCLSLPKKSFISRRITRVNVRKPEQLFKNDLPEILASFKYTKTFLIKNNI